MTKEVKRIILVVILCEFLICLGMSLVFPVIPFIKNEYHFSAFEMGMMSSLFALVQFVTSPVVGRISDKIGRKPMLAWGLVIFPWRNFYLRLPSISGLSTCRVPLTAFLRRCSYRLQWRWRRT